jgi:hypothetical protein
MKQQPNFFEKLGLADKEKIHSQIISWLFSQELQLIDESTKSDLYSKLFKCELPEKYAVYTEWKNMDVVFLDLTGDKPKEALVIENKLKSELHSNQLTKYYEKVKDKLVDKEVQNVHFRLLALYKPYDFHEQNINDNWGFVSYKEFKEELLDLFFRINTQKSVKNYFEHKILEAYKEYLEQLLNCIDNFVKDPKKYLTIYNNGNKSLDEKITSQFKGNEGKNKISDLEQFVFRNNLETTFQKIYLNFIANQKLKTANPELISKYDIGIGETRGSALIDFRVNKDLGIRYKKHIVRWGYQIQGDSYKFTLVVEDLNPSQTKKNNLPKEIQDIKEELKEAILNKAKKEFALKTLRTGKGRYMSCSTNDSANSYWKMDRDVLVKKILEDIKKFENFVRVEMKKITPTPHTPLG